MSGPTRVSTGGTVSTETAGTTVTVRETGIAVLPARSLTEYTTLYVPRAAVFTVLDATTRAVMLPSMLSTAIAP